MVDVGLPDLVAALGGELTGDAGAVRITRIGPFDGATPDTITFLSNPRLAPQLVDCRAGCVIVGPAQRDAAALRGAAIVTPDPYLYFAKLTQWWAKRTRVPAAAGVHPSALVDPSAQIAPSATIGALTVVEAGAIVGERTVIGAHGFIGRDTRIGDDCRFAARVTVNERCRIGARGVLHSGVVIGADGFGFAPTEGRWEKIEQLGAVQIGDDVDIGANTCVDRGALGDTVIGNGVKLDNLIQIGHNVRIGDHSALAGCVGVAGSAVIGKHVMMGGAAMIAGHLEIADHVFISGGTLVSHSIKKAGHYTGVFPIDDNAAWEKNAATLRNLHRLRERVRLLERAAAEKNETTGTP
ncbi:UDP-3-O-(3-hydroxymyristoyl)glucosamine N-acyltransferase [Rhizobacter sp. Root404]|uniref:UDP-3-O-(3-hydroxymyristoyl)glucosamine N-acyltransferase n=1 Tax=Rhizobacter sp. Root404 TaxID=1736528 RepID=UPI0007017A04|nr:UDP-3-O-(3-hydroxymyristoyl)glucosamine N-acyltransferase [Rhizobacter sp. Root404]KQW36681.1 UDP-3-O-(3-hydroxymyristoyl)glucosamine N-acyltransferase [Rhizobacter sp. Root404]